MSARGKWVSTRGQRLEAAISWPKKRILLIAGAAYLALAWAGAWRTHRHTSAPSAVRSKSLNISAHCNVCFTTRRPYPVGHQLTVEKSGFLASRVADLAKGVCANR